jgi:hypothetical protein
MIHFFGAHEASSMTEWTMPVIVNPERVNVFCWPVNWA